MQPNPDSMVLASASPDGAPAARVVLCKKVVADPGYVVFFTNYDSRKGHELAGEFACRRRAALGLDEPAGPTRRPRGVLPARGKRCVFLVARDRQPHRRVGQPAEPAARFARNVAEAGRNRSRSSRHGADAPAALGRIPLLARSRRTVV
ncbi:MAG: pyridoxamine 5'-phosphate oxidase family protein [Proteobacteria bacterium]|nr:pyridoxamine 5'-phosphate oxidase family protein [Pseudomonadota bacterium]